MATNYQDRIQQILNGTDDPQARALLLAKLQQSQSPAAAAPQPEPSGFMIKPEQYSDLAGDAAQMTPPSVAGIPPAAGQVDEQEPGDLLRDKIQMRLAQKGTPEPEVSPWTKAETIGAAKVGDRYEPPTFNEILSGAVSPWRAVTERVIGKARPASVAAQDPFGITAWEQGSGEPPGFFMGSTEPVGLVDEIKALFPRLDAYTKPSGPISRKVILKRIEAMPNLSAEAKAKLTELAEQVGTRRVQPAELHALAAGEEYAPDRVLRRVAPIPEGQKQIVGAPLGVSNARQTRALRERYLKSMERGEQGADWYHDSGEAILFHANDDPTRANLVAGDVAITSPTTSVSANTGFGIKGYNQAIAGVPIAAGRYPTAMGAKIAELHAGTEGSLGLKRDPFAGNIARGGGFLEKDLPNRAVHDIWDAEAHGFVNEDGTPMRTGFGPAQHRFMDEQQDKIIEAANERATGGRTDWDELRSQAGGWTGQQIEAGRLDPNDAAKSVADYLPRHYAQGSRETMPGRTTGHLPELHGSGLERLRERLHSRINTEAGIYDPQMRDQITAGYGGLTGRSFEGPGVYEGQPAPGRQTQILTGSVDVPGSKGARVLDEGSRRILDASESTYGLLTGQDAAAYSRVLPAGSGQARNAWDITLPGGTIAPSQMQTLLTHLGPGGKDMVLIPTPDGVRLAFMNEVTMKGAVKTLGGKVKTAGTFQSNLIGNNWQTHRVGQNYFDAIRTMGTEKFDAFAPKMAQHLREIDRRFAKDTGGRFTLSPVMDEVRGAIANEGWAGLERLAKKYGLPVALLATALAELQAKSGSEATDSQ